MHDRDCRNAQLTPWPKDLPEWEVGRVIQAVEDLGEFDNTLIIYIGYIGGDNGASAEGMLNGAPNEFTTFNGVAVQVKDQFFWYPFWGSERTYPHFAAG
jgi:arylsulfatase